MGYQGVPVGRSGNAVGGLDTLSDLGDFVGEVYKAVTEGPVIDEA